MDKSTNVHQKVAATFISTYYNAIAEGKTADISKMYLPNAKVNHCGADGAAALAAYAKGARVVVSDMEARLVDNTHLKVFVKGSIVVGTEQKKDFQHDVDLVHHNTSANQLAFGVEADFLRIITAVPPPPKMKFDDWAADTPQLAAQSEGDAEVPSIDLIASKGTTPSVTPKVAPTPAPVAPAPVEQQVEEVKPVEEKKEVAAPVVAKAEVAKPATAETTTPAAAPVSEAPKGWASIVRSDKPQGAKTVVSVVDPTKKVAPVVEKKAEEVEKKVEKKEKKEEEEKPKERRSNKSSTPIFYDIFVKGFPEGTTEASVPTTLGLTVAVANTKIDTKEDKSGVRRVFVYIKLSAEDLAKQNITREDAIATIIANNKSTKVGNSRLSVEEVKEKERYHADNSAAKSKK